MGQKTQSEPNRSVFEKSYYDRKFSFLAFIFCGWWFLFKGVWEAAIAGFLISFVLTLLHLIPVVGNILSVILTFAVKIFWGINARYFARLKQDHGISFIEAIKAQRR